MSENLENIHKFEIGKDFAKKSASNIQDYLDVALEIEKSIRSHKVESDSEIFWSDNLISNQKNDEDKNLSLGYGQAGILYFYLQLFSVTNDKNYLPPIEKSAEFISKRWKKTLPDEKSAVYPWPDGQKFGFYGGLSGIGSVFTIAYNILKSEKIKKTLEEIVDELALRAKSENGGITWTKSITTLTDGGILMFLASLYEVLPSQKLKDLIEKSAAWFISQGKTHENGGLEFSDYGSAKLAEPDFKGENVSQPNFELGSAGAGFVLARIYQVLGDKKYLDAAEKVEIYLDSIKVPQKKGFLLPYRINDGQETFFYLGNCHGAAGSGKFYYLLYKITKNQKYLEKLNSLFDGFESLGAPEKMSKGFWNNVSVCCGAAGVLNTTAGAFSSTGQERWENLAKRSSEILLGNLDSLENGKKGWIIAYRRIVPTDFSHTIFYNDGDAGIASALLQFYLIENGKKNKNRLSDDPFEK